MTQRLLCTPPIFEKLESQLDKFHGPVILQGEWHHPFLPYGVEITEAKLREWANKWNAHRQNLEIPTPDGHTDEADKNRGYLDREYEAKVVEYVVNGETVLGLDMGFDIRDPETIRAAKAGTLGRSVSIADDFRYSTPDGEVHSIGEFPRHVAFTSEPVISMPALEPTLALSKTGEKLEFVPLFDCKQLASRMVTWQDPPKDVREGKRKATREEAGYTMGTPEANCSRCLSRSYHYATDPTVEPTMTCDWVDGAIESGECKYFRPRSYSYSTKIDGHELVLLSDSLVLRDLIGEKAKNSDAKYSNKPNESLDCILAMAWNSLLAKANPQIGVTDMDVKALAKECGVAETDDVKAFAKSLSDAAAAKAMKTAELKTDELVATRVADQVRAFAKDLGVDVTDLAKAGEAIKAHFAKTADLKTDPKADPEVQKQFAKLTGDLDSAQQQLAKQADELSAIKLEASVTGRNDKMANRIALAKSEGRMNKADEERILTIAKDGDQPITISLQFSRDAKYDGAWDRNMFRAEILMDEIDRRPKGCAVPGEKTPKNLSRFAQDPATIGNDGEKPTEEQIDKLWGKKRKTAAA